MLLIGLRRIVSVLVPTRARETFIKRRETLSDTSGAISRAEDCSGTPVLPVIRGVVVTVRVASTVEVDSAMVVPVSGGKA